MVQGQFKYRFYRSCVVLNSLEIIFSVGKHFSSSRARFGVVNAFLLVLWRTTHFYADIYQSNVHNEYEENYSGVSTNGW